MIIVPLSKTLDYNPDKIDVAYYILAGIAMDTE